MRKYLPINSKFAIKLFVLTLCSFSSIASSTNQPFVKTLDKLSDINIINKEVKICVPYSFVSNAKFTLQPDTFNFRDYQIKMDKMENSNNIYAKISKINLNQYSNKSEPLLDTKLPWWSISAPPELKQLDFSKVDGKSNSYNLGNGYKLSLIDRQGNWGKVYILEHLTEGSKTKTICAIKLILTRLEDRSLNLGEFQKRHITEINNNLKISKLEIAVKPYGMVKNDDNHYLLFMENGYSVHDHFKKLLPPEMIKQIAVFIKDVEKMHISGYTHGDLKLDNVLLVKNKMKLCDWFSLNEYNKTTVGEYRYIGDNLPPEAIRANYFKNDKKLEYSIVGQKNNQKSYILHPISSDRFCLAVSLLEVLEPDLYKYITYMPKSFNPWSPESLKFYPKYIVRIKNTQEILLKKSENISDKEKRDLYKQISVFLSCDPIKRVVLNSR